MTLTATLTTVRKKLGYQKWYWFQGGRANVSYDRMIEAMDARAAKDLSLLKPIPVPAQTDIECHMLCGHRQITMAVWAWWSLLRFCDGKITPIVHSDGGVTADDVALLERHFPGITFREKSHTTQLMKQHLPEEKYPKLNQLYSKHKLGGKAVAFHLGSRAKKIIMLDSDILFMAPPTELLDYCQSDTHAVIAMQDLMHAYASSCEEISRVIGAEAPDLINSGLVVTEPYNAELIHWLETSLQKMPQAWLDHYFMDQTVLTTVAARQGVRFLSEQYRIESDRYTKPALCLHYVGGKNIRPRFYQEGIPKLQEQIAQGCEITVRAEQPTRVYSQ